MKSDYEMFGLEPNETSLKCAKKAYYNLALLVHPDRNSCPDKKVAHDEMQAVTDAYNRISINIQSKNEKKLIFECDDLKEIQKQEMSSLDQFTKDMPSFMDIYLETHDDLKRFNRLWEEKASMNENGEDYFLNSSKGYEIEPSEYVGQGFDVSYNPNLEINYSYDNSVQVSEALISIENVGGSLSLLNDNSVNTADYREAFGNSVPLANQLPSDVVSKYQNTDDIEMLFQRKNEEFSNQP